jgi:hypothetical protein
MRCSHSSAGDWARGLRPLLFAGGDPLDEVVCVVAGGFGLVGEVEV